MSSAAGLVTASPLQIALQVPPDSAAMPAGGGDFSAALASACLAEPQGGLPEGMQSAAALAWLAGIADDAQPDLQGGTDLLVDAAQAGDEADAVVPPDAGDGEAVPAASALSFLQQMLQPAAPAPQGAAIQSPGSEEPGGADGTAQIVPLAAQPAPRTSTLLAPDPQAMAEAGPAEEIDTSSDGAVATDVRSAASAVTPVTARAPAAAQGSTAGTLADARETGRDLRGIAPAGDKQPAVNAGERLVGALAERVSSRPDGTTSAVDTERSTVPGPHLYASTREAVATTAGQVSARPEVVHATVGSPRWANELGSRLAMMSVRGQNEGSLTLTPEHLGPLEVRITVNQDTTNVWFGAQNADTRAALADAIPRLREMFAASGLSLGHAGVSHGMPGQEARPGETFAPRGDAVPEPTAEPPAPRVARVSTSLLDTWA